MLPGDGASRVHAGGVHQPVTAEPGRGPPHRQQAHLATTQGPDVTARELCDSPRKYHGM